ncbi:MAG: PAS domain S-box protein [Dongiaceae bacterium]
MALLAGHPERDFAKPRILPLLPGIAVGLLLITVVALLWLVEHNARQAAHNELVQDALWVEQSLRFQLRSAEERVRESAENVGTTAQWTARARSLLAVHPEIVRLALIRSDGTLVAAEPSISAVEMTQALSMPQREAAFTSAEQGVLTYSTPFLQQNGQRAFDLYVPIGGNAVDLGVIMATFSMNAMIAHNVPWWFSQKYELRIVDGEGIVLAVNSRLGESTGEASQVIPFNPPTGGLSMIVQQRAPASALGSYIVMSAIIGLALISAAGVYLARQQSGRRRDAERKWLDEHALRRAMEESLTVGLRARDLKGRILYVNSAFCRMTGFSQDELIGRDPPMPYWLPEELEQTFAAHDAILAGRGPSDGFEMRFRRKDGTRFDALIYEAPLIDAEGKQRGWMGSFLDITERKRAAELARQHQEKLQQTSRLVTMGELASSIAHELNQPLAAIASYNAGCLNMVRAGQTDDPEFAVALERLGQQAQRAGSIIRGVYDFVRKTEPKMAPVRLSDIVETSVGLVATEARHKGVRINVNRLDLATPVMVDRIMLEQVLVNLMRNALDAMRDTPTERCCIDVTAHVEPDLVTLAIADHGPGIADDLAEHLFTPFFSTKEHGMGMGLNICRSIIEFHQGRLWFELNPGGGSVFKFTLHRAQI